MAWPPRRRAGSNSRRERNVALLRGLASLFAVLGGLVLLSASRADPAYGGALRQVALDATAPVWRLVRAPFEALGRAGDYVGDYFNAIDRNRQLEAELKRHRERERQRLTLVRENRQLKALLGVVEPDRGWRRVLPISAASSGSYVRSAVVSGGRDAGLRVGQPVRTERGLVGRVVEVGRLASRVLLLTDASSRVPVRVVRTGRPAMVAGVNAPHLEVRFIAEIDGRPKVGDRLVTSGDGGIFPPDVPVGVVTQVKGDQVLARPAAHPEALGYVIVEAPYLPSTGLAAPVATSARAAPDVVPLTAATAPSAGPATAVAPAVVAPSVAVPAGPAVRAPAAVAATPAAAAARTPTP